MKNACFMRVSSEAGKKLEYPSGHEVGKIPAPVIIAKCNNSVKPEIPSLSPTSTRINAMGL